MNQIVLRLTRLACSLAPVVLVAGCVTGSGGQASPTPDQSPTPSGPAPTGFYLRAWQTQALAPQYTFGWLPVATVADGWYIDGRVAVPAIYPGPLWIGPSSSPITQKGIEAIVAEARRLGLLGATTDFTKDTAPGSVLGHIEIAVDGKVYGLVGDPELLTRCRCIPEPGTPPAFAAFWQRVSDLSSWLPDELGPTTPYSPERLAVLLTPPAEGSSGITPGEAVWPLAAPFAAFGVEWGGDLRCGVASGADLALVVPAVKGANQLTRFVDSAGVSKSLQVRVLVPGEPSPCA